MYGTVLCSRTGAVLVLSLLIAGCSGGSSGTNSGELPSDGSPRGAAPSGDDGAGGSPRGTSGSSGGDDGGAGGDDSGVGMSSSPPPNDGGSEDATHPGGSTPDAAAHDAAAVEAGAGDGGDALAAARAQCVQIINMDRATLSPASPALVEDTAEEACVDGQAQADYQANTAHSAFGNCKESAQDECPNWPGPPSSIMTKCLAQMWAEGPPAAGQDNHWLNMSNAKYKKVACGFYQTPAGKWWATQDFY
jgi:hypothetical protein